MAIVISGVNNNDKITAADGTIDLLSGVNYSGILTAPAFTSTGNITAGHINIGSNIQLGNAGVATATTFVGNLTGNVNHTSNLLLQISGSEKFRVGTSGQLGIGGANYGSAGQVLTSGGSGSAATWSTITGTTINNNADNRIITGSGTANTLNGNTYATWNGNNFALRGGEGQNCTIELASDEGDDPADFWRMMAQASDNAFAIDHYGTGSWVEKMRITSTGQLKIGNDPTINAGTIALIEAPSTFNNGETIVAIVGNASSAGPRLLLQNKNTGGSAHGEILGTDNGGQSTSSIRFYNTDQSNNYGEIAFGTRNASGVPPADRMRINKDGQVTKPYQYVFLVSTTNHSKTANWSQITNMGIVTAQCTGVSDGTYWSNSTQRFTAPVTGVYYFYVGGWSYGNSNGSRYAYTFKHQNGNNYDYISGGNYCLVDSPMDGWSRTIKLSAGEWVELWGYSAVAVRWGGGHRFYWGGYLLG